MSKKTKQPGKTRNHFQFTTGLFEDLKDIPKWIEGIRFKILHEGGDEESLESVRFGLEMTYDYDGNYPTIVVYYSRFLTDDEIEAQQKEIDFAVKRKIETYKQLEKELKDLGELPKE